MHCCMHSVEDANNVVAVNGSCESVSQLTPRIQRSTSSHSIVWIEQEELESFFKYKKLFCPVVISYHSMYVALSTSALKHPSFPVLSKSSQSLL